MAMDSISNLVLNGSINSNIIIDGELWYRNVSWTAINAYNNTIEITINKQTIN